tara:strand:+ start:4147 stop:4488 length:342 start_codon:yes stop_codon:yes gene_type:complete
MNESVFYPVVVAVIILSAFSYLWVMSKVAWFITRRGAKTTVRLIPNDTREMIYFAIIQPHWFPFSFPSGKMSTDDLAAYGAREILRSGVDFADPGFPVKMLELAQSAQERDTE